MDFEDYYRKNIFNNSNIILQDNDLKKFFNDNGLKEKLKQWINDVFERIGKKFGVKLTSEQIKNMFSV
mgnify:CR=1 FL=1